MVTREEVKKVRNFVNKLRYGVNVSITCDEQGAQQECKRSFDVLPELSISLIISNIFL